MTLRAVQLARNALTGAGRYAVGAVLALAITPYMLHVLGAEQFGLWALAGAVIPTVRLLDLGLNRSLTRAVAAAVGRGDPAAAARSLATAHVLAVAIALVAVATVWIARAWLVDSLLHVPKALQAEAAFVIVGTAIVVATEGCFSPFQASLDGLGRMDLTNSTDTVQRIASALAAVPVLALGWGLPGLVWKNLLTAVLAGVSYWWILARRAPELGAAPMAPDRDEARRLIGYGRHVQAVNLSALLVEPVSKALLQRYTGLPTVAYYELALRVTNQVGGGFLALVAAVFPAAAAQRSIRDMSGTFDSSGAHDASGTHESISTHESGGTRESTSTHEPISTHDSSVTHDSSGTTALYRSTVRYVAWLALPVYILMIVLADPFVAAWLGPGYAPVGRAIAVLGIGWWVAILSMPAFLMAQAGGHERLATASGLVTAASTIGLGALWVRQTGLAGIVMAGAVGLGVGGLMAVVLFERTLGGGKRKRSENVDGGIGARLGPGWILLSAVSWRPWLAALIGASGAGLVVQLWPASLVGVLVAGAAGAAIYGAVMVASGAVGQHERALLAELLGLDRWVGSERLGRHSGRGRSR